jgi:hypothetical protein
MIIINFILLIWGLMFIEVKKFMQGYKNRDSCVLNFSLSNPKTLITIIGNSSLFALLSFH